jgi:threonine 3-dehydrogenase
MTVLVTGGTGFIGAEIVRLLHERGDGPIHVASRTGNTGRLGELAGQVSQHRVDLADGDAVAALVREVEPTVLYHFGAMLTGPGEQDPQALLQANVVGLIRLYEEARLAGVEQLIFASSIGTYGRDLGDGPISDLSLQRPLSVYGVGKVFAENLGAYYRLKYGLDYRGIRYPSIVGPGVTTRSVVQYTSWVIEHPARGEPFVVWVEPDTVVPILYYKDAARAAVDLADAPSERIRSINYLVNGVPPTPSAGELADAVRMAIPGADITFDPDPAYAGIVEVMRPIDDSAAREEWSWSPRFDLDAMISDLIAERAGPA